MFLNEISPMQCNQTSVDVTFSGDVITESSVYSSSCLIDFKEPDSKLVVESQSVDSIIISAGSVARIKIAEKIDLPNNVCGTLMSVNSLNNVNVSLLDNIWIRPSWSGDLWVNIRNNNQMHDYHLHKGSIIGQLVLFILT
jgi:deoxycytidine triphosphate deaminase